MDDRLRQLETVIGDLRRTRFPHGVECPRCRERRVHRWGSFSGRRRYRCTACRRTFSDLTGTPVSNLKRIELVQAYARCLADSLTIRAAARAVGLAPSTAFRWRHRLLRDLDTNRPETLRGWIELTTRRVPASCKGQRHLARQARRRGAAPGRAPPHTSVLIAVDPYHNVVAASIPQEWVSGPDLEASIGSHIEGRRLIVAAEGPLGRASLFARRAGGRFRDARPIGGRRIHTVDAARAHGIGLAVWMERFHGVATKYLSNYVAWHRSLSYAARHGLGEAVLRWPMESAQQLPRTEPHCDETGEEPPGPPALPVLFRGLFASTARRTAPCRREWR
jgi:transposase-like protein